MHHNKKKFGLQQETRTNQESSNVDVDVAMNADQDL